MGVISQMLGKPQPEEEDELMGLVDHGDGSHSSDAKLDTGAEEGVLDVSDPLSTEVKPRILLRPVCRILGLTRLAQRSSQGSCTQA